MNDLTEHTREIAQRYRTHWDNADLGGIFSILSIDAEYISYSGSSQTQPEDLMEYIKVALPSAQKSYIYHGNLCVDGQVAITTYSFDYKSKTSDQIKSYYCCDIMTFRNGKLIRVHEFNSIIEQPLKLKSDAGTKIALDEYRINILADDLNDYFSQHPYLNTELSLSDVANATGYTRNQISYVLNHIFEMSFYDFINYARIDYLLNQLISNYNGNINDIASSAGFNSITTFYKFFKLQTGLTPKSYLKQAEK